MLTAKTLPVVSPSGDETLDNAVQGIMANWDKPQPQVSDDTIALLLAANRQQQVAALQACRAAVKGAWGLPQNRGGQPHVMEVSSFYLQQPELRQYLNELVTHLPQQVASVDLNSVVRRSLLG